MSTEKNISGLEQLNAKLMTLIGGLANLRPMYNEIGMFLVSVTQRNFVLQGRPDRWKESIRAKNTGGQTLRDTGALMNSIIAEPTDNGVEIGPSGVVTKFARILGEGGVITAKNAPYLMFRIATGMRKVDKSGNPLKRPVATFGFVRVKSVTIPPRPYLYVPPEDEERAARIAIAYLGGELA